MSNPFSGRVGGVVSADIAVPEHARAVRFYSRVLCTGERPLWREDLMNNLGMPIIGLGARSAEYAQLPLQWMPHIQVADVAGSVERALERGGGELLHARDERGASQWAVLRDPHGAAFGIIPVVAEEEASTGSGASGSDAAAAGRIVWLELTVPDPSLTCDFYRHVVGWSAREVEKQDASGGYADYQLLGGDGQPAAGICHARGVNAGMPAIWIIHLPVGDLAESLRRVREEGGRILQAPAGTNRGRARAVMQDVVGAHVALVPG